MENDDYNDEVTLRERTRAAAYETDKEIDDREFVVSYV